jgi:hypothetical protein
MIRIVETPPLKLKPRARPILSPLEIEQVSIIAWLYLMLFDACSSKGN